MKWIVILSASFLLQCKTAEHLNVQKQSLSETQDPYLKVAQDLHLAFQNYTQSNPPNDTDHQTLNTLANNINNTPIENIKSVIQNPDLAKTCDQICHKNAKKKKQNQNILSITMGTVSIVFLLIYVLADTKYTSDKTEFKELQNLYDNTETYRKNAVKNGGADSTIPYLEKIFGDKFQKYHDIMSQAHKNADDKIPDDLLVPGREDEHRKTFNTLVNEEMRNSLKNDPEMLRKFELFVVQPVTRPEVPKLYKYVSIVAPIVALGSAITSATSILGLTDDSRESKLQHDLEIINNELTQLIMTDPK